MRKTRWFVVCLGLLLACGGSGSADDETDEESEGEPTGATCPKDSTLTYESFAKPFFTDYCVRCHATGVVGADRRGAPLDHNFETLDGILDELEHVENGAAGGPKAINQAMPPSGTAPSDAERKQLGEWIACGAPEN